MLSRRSAVRLQGATLRARSPLNLTRRWCVGDGKREEVGGHSWMGKSATGLGLNAADDCNLHHLASYAGSLRTDFELLSSSSLFLHISGLKCTFSQSGGT